MTIPQGNPLDPYALLLLRRVREPDRSRLTLFGLITGTLVARRSMWNYPFALAMVSLYPWVFLVEKVYSDALLHYLLRGREPVWLVELDWFDAWTDTADFYLLFDIDPPCVAEGTRIFGTPHLRQRFFDPPTPSSSVARCVGRWSQARGKSDLTRARAAIEKEMLALQP